VRSRPHFELRSVQMADARQPGLIRENLTVLAYWADQPLTLQAFRRRLPHRLSPMTDTAGHPPAATAPAASTSWTSRTC
jgi:hypothetical protein